MTFKKIQLTESILHITDKSLLAITESNQIYKLEYVIYTSRRPHPEKEPTTWNEMMEQLNEELNEDKEIQVKNKKLPVYDGVIPQKNTNYLSYDLQLSQLSELKVFPTRLESTSGLIAYGHDIFFARMAAENNFDRLQEGFNFLKIFVVILVMFGGVVAMSTYHTNDESKKKFLQR